MTTSLEPLQRAVELVNLGTPDAPTPAAVRRYLRAFLSDPRVIDLNAVGRWLLLNLVILPFRPRKTAKLYQSVWLEGGSPLLVHSQAQQRALQAKLPGTEVLLAMRYGAPSLDQALARCDALRIRDITIVPLFPHEASATTGSVREAVFRAYEGHPRVPSLRMVAPFFDDAGYLEAVSAQLRTSLPPDVQHVLFSYHGLPERQLRREDGTGHCLSSPDCCLTNRHCYRAQCLATTRALAAKLAVPHTTTFQSRLGRTPWLAPFTDHVLQELAAKGVKRVALIAPGFVADCLETLEELGTRAVEQFRSLGGESLTVVPCLNDDPAFIEVLARLSRPDRA